MTKLQIIDKISSNLFREKGHLETRASYSKIRTYLAQLDIEELKTILNEFDK